MKLIQAISMCGGMDHAIHVQFERHARVIDHYYFITFVDLFPTDKQRLHPIYNDFLDTISFGIGKKYKTP